MRLLSAPGVGVLVATLLLGACAEDSSDDGATPEEVLAGAKTQLDETSGVSLSLSTAELPDGIDGVLEATGVGTHAPAFDGTLTVLASEVSIDVPVIAVGGVVHAQLPFTDGYVPVNPADYGAPDPAQLMDTEGGVSSWLTAATDVTRGEQTRDGEAVLTSYTGTLPGSAVTEVIPSAEESADFPATFSIDDRGRLVRAEVAGPFYGDAGEVDYTVKLTKYGTERDITAP